MVTARDVAAELRARLPNLAALQLHKHLYLVQGHHLATFGTPLFSDTISAWDMGPVVGTLWRAEKDGEELGDPAPLGEAELNTIGYVVSRYGRLSGRDLMVLTHGQDPWKVRTSDAREAPASGSNRKRSGPTSPRRISTRLATAAPYLSTRRC